MAAIIAQLTRNKRERAAKISYEANKCLYYIPPFDQHFDPYVHNKYLARYKLSQISGYISIFLIQETGYGTEQDQKKSDYKREN